MTRPKRRHRDFARYADAIREHHERARPDGIVPVIEAPENARWIEGLRRFGRALSAAAVIIGVGLAVLLLRLIRRLRGAANTLCWMAGVYAALELVDRLVSPAAAMAFAIFALGLCLGRLWEAGRAPSTNHHA